MQRALDCGVSVRLTPSVNPLVYTMAISFSEPQSGRQMMALWNIVQKYAAVNDAVPEGKLGGEGRALVVRLGIKRRLGVPKKLTP
jgi:hypothetical protein